MMRRLALAIAAAGALALGLAAGAQAAHHGSQDHRQRSATTVVTTVVQTVEQGATQRDELGEEAVTTSDDPAQLHSDLNRLADAWSQGGGHDGYPFWEKAWRRWQAGQLAGSGLREYASAYLTMLQGGRDRIDSADISTDSAHDVRDILLDSLDDRIDAMQQLVGYLDAQLQRAEDVDGVELPVVRQQVETQLQSSYASARRAMNRSQALLDGTGQPRIPEDAFV